MTGAALLEISGLGVAYPGRGWRRPPVQAVSDVSFSIGPGETLGLVGESGSGKSTIARAVLGLVSPAAGRIVFDGHDITHASYRQRRELAADLSAVFQDPYSSLNPALTIGSILSEPLVVQHVERSAAGARITALLDSVGLPSDTVHRYPRQFSGGQRQRIAIARALTMQPKLTICDEPVSSLDVSIQAQIINLLADLRDEMSLAMLFVAHDLSVVRHIADRTAVLYRGEIMEIGPATEVHDHPRHPYTVALVASALVPDPAEQQRRRSERHALTRRGASTAGAVTSLSIGCPFAPRCPHRMPICDGVRPPLIDVDNGVSVACHLFTDSERSA